MRMKDYKEFAPTLLRIVLGLLFLVPGLFKLLDSSKIIGMLGGLGFPFASFFGWLVIISEVLFGFLLLVGVKVKYSVIPLAIIIIVAIIKVVIPNMNGSFLNLLFHILAVAVMISIALTGPGKYAISKK